MNKNKKNKQKLFLENKNLGFDFKKLNFGWDVLRCVVSFFYFYFLILK